MSDADGLLDLADIQGNILRPYGFRSGGYLFVAVHDPDVGRKWLGQLKVTTAAPWSPQSKPQHALNVAISAAGLKALGVPPERIATFEPAFCKGMLARAASLGDVGANGPDQWEEALRGKVDVVVLVHARTDELAEQRMRELRAQIEAAGKKMEIVHGLACATLDKQREHFGFSDGFGQPAVEGSGHDHLRGQGAPRRRGGWRPLKAGEFILGYEDEDGVRPDMPEPPLGANGSYLVIRKLEQHVKPFRDWVATMAKKFDLEQDHVAAMMVGRWQDGTPLSLSPKKPDPAISSDRASINDFRYRDDPHGERCPLGAHVRRTNPRDDLDRKARLASRRRMLRRGMPYGEELREGENDNEARGLVFACYVASIERQFEEVQRTWCNDGDDFGLGLDRDPIAGRPPVDGEGSNKMSVGGRSPHFFALPREPLVQTRGGEYLFAPGVAALRAIVKGEW